MNTRACRKNGGSCRKHARTKEYSIDLVENTSLQNPHTLTHVSPSCDFTCDWSKLNAWPTPWQHGLSTCGSLVAISHVIGRNWPDRLSSASRITYWLAIAYRQVNKHFSVLVSTCVCTVDTKIGRKAIWTFPKISQDFWRLATTFEQDPKMFRLYIDAFKFNLRDLLCSHSDGDLVIFLYCVKI